MSDNINKRASKAGLWNTIGNMLLKGCAFLTLPIFTRILSTSDFGIYNTYIAYEGLLAAVLGLGLYGTIKNAKLDYSEKFDEYISSVLTLSFLTFIIVLVLANITYDFYSATLGFSRLVTNCLICQSFGTYFLHFYGIKLNTEFNYKSFLLISVVNTIGNVLISIFLILIVFPQERYLGRIFGTAIPPILITIIVGLLVYRKGKVAYKNSYWRYGLRIGLPLVPHVVSQSLLSQFDRSMINNMVGSSQASHI